MTKADAETISWYCILSVFILGIIVGFFINQNELLKCNYEKGILWEGVRLGEQSAYYYAQQMELCERRNWTYIYNYSDDFEDYKQVYEWESD